MVVTTINLRANDGTLFNLAERIKAVHTVLSQPSVVEEVTISSGKGFYTGYVVKKSKRTQGEFNANTGVGNTSGFIGATAQVAGKVFVEKTYRTDNIIVDEIDVNYIASNEKGDAGLVASEVGDFLITAQELDLKWLLTTARTAADGMKLFSSVVKNPAGSLIPASPNGTQPVQADAKFASALAAIAGGKRVVNCSELDTAADNRIKLIRGVLGYGNRIGAETSIETFYPYSINGIPLGSFKILTYFEGSVAIKDSLTTTVINLNDPGSTRNLNGLVGFIDTVKVLITNVRDPKNEYTILSGRALTRDIDTLTNYVGTIKKEVGAVKMADGTVENVSPTQYLIQMNQGRTLGAIYFEEIWFIDKAPAAP